MTTKSRLSLQTVFVRHGAAYVAAHEGQLPSHHERSFTKIINCRTEVMGGQVHACKCCGMKNHSWYSCNDRLCDQCGDEATHQWYASHVEKLIDGVPYFMVTFTLPQELRNWVRNDSTLWVDEFFAAAGSALMSGLKAKLGGDAGFFGVYQSWKRDLGYHPHIHFIVPGGVLQQSDDGQQKWGQVRLKTKTNQWYLASGKDLAAKMRNALEQGIRTRDPELYTKIPKSVWKKSKQADVRDMGQGHNAIKYLAKYVARSALGKGRIVRDKGNAVSFTYTPSGQKRAKRMTLPAVEFIGRMLQHALPKGLKRVRYFGWMHPSAKRRLQLVRALSNEGHVKHIIHASNEQPEHKRKCKSCGSEDLEKVGEELPYTKLMRIRLAILKYGIVQPKVEPLTPVIVTDAAGSTLPKAHSPPARSPPSRMSARRATTRPIAP